MKNPDSNVTSEILGDSFGCLTQTEQISNNSQRVARALQYMAQRLDKPLRVSELAAVANVSLSHLFTLFKQHTGCSPKEYFTRLRMRHACQFLESSQARVKEIAEALGYDDPFYFSRVFKLSSAVAPMHYRGLGLESRFEIKERLESKHQIPTVLRDSLASASYKSPVPASSFSRLESRTLL